MTTVLNTIQQINANINGFIWSPFMLAVLLGTGLYLSIRTGFMQIFKMRSILSETILKAFKKNRNKTNKNGITPFQALSTALAGTVGTGNIAGVATALTIAGPGAIFWMWISAFLGMMTKYAEIVLAIQYRKKNANGEWLGGPMIYIRDGLKMNKFATVYAVLGICASFGVGNMAQANSISSAVKDAFHIHPLFCGILVAIAVGLTISGGVKKITKVTEKLVPLMSIFYTVSALFVIFCYRNQIPSAISLIVTSAFKPTAPMGGFVGASVATAIQKGISRGIFTNEAGMGSASIAHASAETDHPARQGIWGIFEVFFDTIIMCTITAIAILVTGTWANGMSGTSLTVYAFDTVMNGWGKYIIAISLVFFAFSTMLAWSFYGKKCLEYISGEKYHKHYLTLFLVVIVLGSVGELHLVWEISDVLNGLMIIPNIIAIICLSGVVIKKTKEGINRMDL